MDIKLIKTMNTEIKVSDFSKFDKLLQSDKVEVMKTWDMDMKHKYLTRNPVMSEEEFFAELDKIAEGKFTDL